MKSDVSAGNGDTVRQGAKDAAFFEVPTENDFASRLIERGFDADTLSVGHTGTILPTLRRDLPQTLEFSAGLASEELELHETIGEGGMGVVRLATQRPMRRQVAVKSGAGADDGTKGAGQLLREAWVTGALEHPNIVPVYTVKRADDGAPLIVMKRIEGTPWSELIANPNHPAWPKDAHDRVGWHIDVLVQVCRAIEFAHASGIIHRDIKPDNVMVGAFGEVYVLDWGLAASVQRDPTGRFTSVDDVTEIVGTPGYLAPEMVAVDDRILTRKTDIYLLGATLHELLTGETRHPTTSITKALYHALKSPPVEYGDSVPPELGAIANRATARDPDDRFESVAALRVALAASRTHAASTALAREAFGRLHALTPQLAVRERQEIFGECTFGFRQALREWPDSPEAQEGLRCLELCRIEDAIQREDAVGARAILDGLGEVDSAVHSSVEALEAQVAARRKDSSRLAAMEQDLDLDVGRKSRVTAVVVLGVIWATFAPILLLGHQQLGWPLDARTLFIDGLGGVVLVLIIAFIGRERLFANLISRRISACLVVGGLSYMMARTAAYVIDLPFAHVMLFDFVAMFASIAALALLVDRRALTAAAFHLVMFFAAVFSPDAWIVWLLSGANCGALLLLGVAWRLSPSKAVAASD